MNRHYLIAVAMTFLWTANIFASGSAAGVGGNPQQNFQGDPSGIDIEATFFIDPEGPMWQKFIEIDTTQGLNPGQVIPVHEQLFIVFPPQGVPVLPLWDWHEEVHDPFFFWNPDPSPDMNVLHIHDPQNPTGPPLIEVQGEVGMSPGGHPNNAIWFDPIEPHPFPTPSEPIDVWIWKELIYNGPPITPNSQNTPIVLEIWEYPTVPEPSGVLLMGIGVLGLILLARFFPRGVPG